MKSFYTLFIFLLAKSIIAQNPSYDWAQLYGGTSSGTNPFRVIIGADSSIYTVGNFVGTCNFELNSGLTELISTLGDPDMFIAKHSKEGDLIWVKHFDGSGAVNVMGMAQDSMENIYVSGQYWGTMDCDPSAGVSNITALGSQDNFIFKIDSTGNLIWVHSTGEGSIQYGWGCSIGNDGYLYLYGNVNGIVDCDLGPGVYNTGGSVLLKCDLDGNLIWVNNYGNIIINQVTQNSTGNLVLCGIYYGPFQDFDGKAGVYNVNLQGAAGDIFVSTIDQNGDLIWVGAMGGDLTEAVFMQLDNADNIYLASRLSLNTDLDWGAGTFIPVPGGGFDAYLSKYSAVGNHLWTKQLEGTGSDGVDAMKIDGTGNIYVAGRLDQTTDFDPSTATFEMTCSSPACRYLAKYDPDGNFVWVKQFGNDTNDKFVDLNVDPSDSLIILGTFKGNHDLNLTAGNYDVNSGTNVYTMLMKYGNCQLSSDSVLNVVVCNSYTLNGQTYSTTGTFVQQIEGYNGCDSTIILELTVDPGSFQPVSNITQNLTLLTVNAAATNYQWLNCDDGYVSLAGMNGTDFIAPGIGNFAVMVDSAGCIDTSACYMINALDFYNSPGYISLFGEVFPFPVSNFTTCDAEAMSFISGGVQPYDVTWSHDPSLNNQVYAMDICYGFYTYKIVDNIGDSLIIPYFITDSINYYDWYNPGTETDTLYLNTENCSLDYNLPLDSVELSIFDFIGPDLSGIGDLYLTGINYYQGGALYYYEDTLVISTTGDQLIMYAFWCPTKSNSTIKIVKYLLKFPEVLDIDDSNKDDLFLFPNPTFGKINFSRQIDGFELYDISGKIIFTCEEKMQGFDLSFLSPGLYFIRVYSEGQTGSVSKVFLLSE